MNDTDDNLRLVHELIAALDRRIPQMQRVGEEAIAQEAAALRLRAMARIAELEGDLSTAKPPS